MQAGPWNYVGIVVGYAVIICALVFRRRLRVMRDVVALFGAVAIGLATISRPEYHPVWLQLLFFPPMFVALWLARSTRLHEKAKRS